MPAPQVTSPIPSSTPRLPVVLEMETADPDDFLTLLWLADHPAVEHLGVVLTPGRRDQCRLVRWGLDQCGATEVPIGVAYGTAWWDTPKGSRPSVSGFHARAFGEQVRTYPTGEVHVGPELVAALLRSHHATILVGSPPRNVAQAMALNPDVRLTRLVQQGGFAGQSLVASPLPKFAGLETCPSWNLGGAVPETLSLLESTRIGRRLFVSKNVCHGVRWTPALRAAVLREAGGTDAMRPGLQLVVRALDLYGESRGNPKALHDLVAAACALDERVCTFTEVQLYLERGAWGARRAEGSATWISTGWDPDLFAHIFAT